MSFAQELAIRKLFRIRIDKIPNLYFFDLHSGACRKKTESCRTTTTKIYSTFIGSGNADCSCGTSSNLDAPVLQNQTRTCSTTGTWTY